MKCLRALKMPLFGELRQDIDFSWAVPGELVVPPIRVCDREDDASCPCRRVFLGVVTNAATTMAIVVDEHEEELLEEFTNAPLARALWGGQRSTFAADHLARVSEALADFPCGSVVRIRTAARQQSIYPAELVQDEAEALQENYRVVA